MNQQFKRILTEIVGATNAVRRCSLTQNLETIYEGTISGYRFSDSLQKRIGPVLGGMKMRKIERKTRGVGPNVSFSERFIKCSLPVLCYSTLLY